MKTRAEIKDSSSMNYGRAGLAGQDFLRHFPFFRGLQLMSDCFLLKEVINDSARLDQGSAYVLP